MPQRFGHRACRHNCRVARFFEPLKHGAGEIDMHWIGFKVINEDAGVQRDTGMSGDVSTDRDQQFVTGGDAERLTGFTRLHNLIL